MNQSENVFMQAKVILKNGRIRFGIILSKIAELETGKDMMFISDAVESDADNYRIRDIETISSMQVRGIDLLLK